MSVLSHQSNAPQLAGHSCKKQKAAPAKANLISQKIWGVPGGPPNSTSQAVRDGGSLFTPASLQSSAALPSLLPRKVLGAHLAQFTG